VLEVISGSAITAADPLAQTLRLRQPGPAFDAFVDGWIDDLARAFG
jgi:hypothetical protein